MSSWIECNKTLLMTQLDKEKKTFYLICLYHIIVWTILPFLANKNLPLDTIEALAWGGSFDLGYNKHPPLSAWITGLLFKFFGNKDFIYYLLSKKKTFSFYFTSFVYSLSVSILLIQFSY